jgi:hypothetical protein
MDGEAHESESGTPGWAENRDPEAVYVMAPRAGRSTRICKILIAGFAVLYACALALMAIGSLGLFGTERDPLSAVFLIPVGLPWNLFVGNAPEALLPWLAAGAPLLNLLIIWFACRRWTRTAPN